MNLDQIECFGFEQLKKMRVASIFRHRDLDTRSRSLWFRVCVIYNFVYRDNDNKITDCYGSNTVHEMCDTGTGAGVICE